MSGLIDWGDCTVHSGRPCHRDTGVPTASARGRHRAGGGLRRHVSRAAWSAFHGRSSASDRRSQRPT